MTRESTEPASPDDLTTRQPVSGPRRVTLPGHLPALTIVYHPDLDRVGERAILRDISLREAIALSRREPVFSRPGERDGTPLEDPHVSRTPLRFIALPDAQIRLSVAENRATTVVEGEPLSGIRDFSREELERGVVIELSNRIVLLLHLLDPAGVEQGDGLGLVGDNHLMEGVRRDIRSVADLEMPVLIRGETGTGKELVARAIHVASGRRARPFVAVNMAAITPSLAAAELFGAERGAYTGAVESHTGYFGKAEGGTLFLDEIGEALPDVQGMLLRAIETGEIQAVGARSPRRAHVRLVTATDADLESKIASGGFRAPLLHRLTGYEISLCPLRERRDDIARLFIHFLRAELATLGEDRLLDATGSSGKHWLTASAVARLARHDWPGNVRQLRNVVRQLVVSSRGAPCIDDGSVLERLLKRPVTGPPAPGPREVCGDAPAPSPRQRVLPDPVDDRRPSERGEASSRRKPSNVSEEELLDALRRTRWDLKAAAEVLRVSRTSLYAMVDNCPLVRRAGDLSQEEIIECFRACGGDIDAMVDRLEVSKQALRRRLGDLRLG